MEKIAKNISNSFFLELKEGLWTLEIKQGNMVDQVKFEVKLSLSSSYPKRFSVSK